MEQDKKDIKKWLKKIEEVKKGEVDLSTDEDLSIAIMNLVSLEEHFYFTAMKLNDQKYLDMLHSVRELRKKMMEKIVKDPKGEEWCISKHLLGASMRLTEVGTKELSKNGAKKADPYFKSAFELYSLFFALNLGLIDSKKIDSAELAKEQEKRGIMGKFSGIVKDIVNCCKEW